MKTSKETRENTILRPTERAIVSLSEIGSESGAGIPLESLCESPNELGEQNFTIALEFEDPDSKFGSKQQEIFRVGEQKASVRLWLGSLASERDIIAEFHSTEGTYQILAPMKLVDDDAIHSVVLRYDGRTFELHLDGLLLHMHGSAVGNPAFRGKALFFPNASTTPTYWHLWNTPLTDDELMELAGGAERVAHKRGELERKLPSLTAERRAKALADPHHPAFHLTAGANWLNDPNGFFYWRGQYHLYFQHHPFGPYWGPMHWGHAVSRDLLHWEHRPIALRPTPGGVDARGCYSGCIVDTGEGRPALFYTGVFPETQCLAWAQDDELVAWSKDPGNPLISDLPEPMVHEGFRDPWVWREGEDWLMTVGSGLRGKGAFLPLFRSRDLRTWEYLHPLFEGDLEVYGPFWECPSFFKLGGKFVLLISQGPFARCIYFIGSYEDRRFIPEAEGYVDVGGNFYAPHTLLDDKDRRLMIGWLWEARREQAQFLSGWAGAMSLPRVLSLSDEGTRLIQEPIAELATLRRDSYQRSDTSLRPGQPQFMDKIGGERLELQVTLDPKEAARVGVGLRCAPEGAEETLVEYDREESALRIRRHRSSLNEHVDRETRKGTLGLADDEPLRLHIVLDHSILEIFANGHFCLTARIYPTREDSQRVYLYAEGGEARLIDFQGWTLRSLRPEEKMAQ